MVLCLFGKLNLHDDNANKNSMFHSAFAFNHNINEWDVSAVTTMSDMFNHASAFNHSINEWDVSAVIDMSYMFSSASAFNHNINEWTVSAGTACSSFAGGTANAFPMPSFSRCTP